ncbi:ABC transporter permease [Chloroflexota bacterium]
MNRQRIKNILFKEWRVLTGEATTFMLITLIPFAILGEGILMIWLIANIGGEAMAANPFFQGALEKVLTGYPTAIGLPDIDRVKLLLLSQLNLFILLIPTMIAIYSASYSIVEEKISRSLEPLLATPVRTWELLMGKALAGFIPAMLITWVCAGVSLLVVAFLGWGYLLTHFINATWFLNLFLITPGIALLSFLLGVIGSSKAKDFRNAQNMVLFIIFPVFGVIAVQVTGVIWFTPLWMLALGLAICLIDLLVLRIAVRLFQRESIVVRWR